MKRVQGAVHDILFSPGEGEYCGPGWRTIAIHMRNHDGLHDHFLLLERYRGARAGGESIRQRFNSNESSLVHQELPCDPVAAVARVQPLGLDRAWQYSSQASVMYVVKISPQVRSNPPKQLKTIHSFQI